MNMFDKAFKKTEKDNLLKESLVWITVNFIIQRIRLILIDLKGRKHIVRPF